MTSKTTLRNYMIDKAGRKWNTKPERAFRAYSELRRMELVQNVVLPFVAENREGRIQRFDFQLDFAHPLDSKTGCLYDVDYEVDGDGHNSKHDLWKDNIKNSRGLKVIHIPGVLTAKKFWPHLDKWLPMALLSPSPTVYIGGGSSDFP